VGIAEACLPRSVPLPQVSLPAMTGPRSDHSARSLVGSVGGSPNSPFM
jgi:hypothetical protein